MPRILSDEDVEAVAQRVVSLMDLRMNHSLPQAEGPERFLSSTAVMALLGYRCRSAFWQFVHSRAVPCVRLGPRRIVFDRNQLEDWLDRRSTVHVRY
jgi:predicted DNA-binding transcriptional regulator AlpA